MFNSFTLPDLCLRLMLESSAVGSVHPRENLFARQTINNAIRHPPATASAIATARQNPVAAGYKSPYPSVVNVIVLKYKPCKNDDDSVAEPR